MVRLTAMKTNFANDRLGPDTSDQHQLHFYCVVLPIPCSNGDHSRQPSGSIQNNRSGNWVCYFTYSASHILTISIGYLHAEC